MTTTAAPINPNGAQTEVALEQLPIQPKKAKQLKKRKGWKYRLGIKKTKEQKATKGVDLGLLSILASILASVLFLTGVVLVIVGVIIGGGLFSFSALGLAITALILSLVAKREGLAKLGFKLALTITIILVALLILSLLL